MQQKAAHVLLSKCVGRMKQVSSLKPGAAKATALLFTFVGGSLMGGMMISSLKDNSPQKAQVLGSALPNTAHAAPAADTAPFLSARWASLLAGVVAPQWAGATVYPEVTFHHGRPTMHILVTGGAGFIGSHAVLRLMDDGHAVTVIDNFSRGNAGAIEALMRQAKPGQLRFVWMDLADSHKLNSLFTQSDFDVVIHFAAVAYVGESYANPILYYRNITSNTIKLLHAMEHGGVTKLVYSSTCATYGNAKTMPITESTPQIPVSPYGRSKLMAEQVIKDFTALSQNNFQAVLLRYFNVIGSDPLQRVGESPREALAQKYGRISGACFDAAIGKRKQLTILGTDHATPDGTCVRDYIHVVDLVDAHIKGIQIRCNTLSIFFAEALSHGMLCYGFLSFGGGEF